MKQESFLKYFIVLLFTSILLFTGCERKTDDADRPAGDTLRTDTTAAETTKTASDTLNIQGTWTGTLDQRPSTLNITEFKENKVKGTIRTRARDAVTQQIEGTFVPESRTLRLTDQTRSRSMGRYSATISEDGKTISGTFTSNDNSTTYNFSYKKENK